MSRKDKDTAALVAEMVEAFKYYPKPPFEAVPYDAVRGITWTICDGGGRHIAIVFDREAAMLIAARLNA